MAYIPKYEHDVFISYAHGDNRDWISRFVDRLRSVTRSSLGVEARFWIDENDLRRTRDFSMEIPENLKSSATMILFPSPTYIRSRYCVEEECRIYREG